MLKKYTLVIIIFLYQVPVFCQIFPDSNYFDIATLNDSAYIIKKSFIFIDTNNIANESNITSQPFIPLKKFPYRVNIDPRIVPKTAYIQIGLFNNSPTPDTVSILPGKIFEEIISYQRMEDNSLRFAGEGSATGFCHLYLQPNEKKIYIIKLKMCRFDYNFFRPIIIKTNYLNTFLSVFNRSNEDIRYVGFILSGMLFMMILFIIVNYALSNKKEFLFYLGYALSMFLLILLLSFLNFAWGSLSSFFNGYLDLFLLIAGNVFYLAFTRHFLDTKNKYKNLDSIFKTSEWFLLLLLFSFTVIHYFTGWYFIERLLENFMKIIFLIIGIVFIIVAYKQKERLINYLATGSALSIFFSIISLLLILLRVSQNSILTSALFYYEIGIVFALAFFLLGLTYKNRMELIGRIKEQEALKLDVEKKDFENQISIIKAQQEERNRISADMHDDLGAGMTTIRLYSELAKSKMGASIIPEIDKISTSANELLNKMNAIIWSMSSSNDTLGNMIAYIRSYSLEYFENTGIACNISIPENLPNIVVSGEIRRNVFLVVKEALHNVVKHSKASEVKITLVKEDKALKLFIQDNGKGIDFENLRQFGNGLKNMKKRMNDLGIIFTIENNNGTLVTLHRVINDTNFS